MRNLRWNCEEGKKCYIEQVLPNWAVFNESFTPTRIKVSDIDGVVERNGQFLFIEVKQNKFIPTGQEILFKNLTRNASHISVLVLLAQNVSENMDIQAYIVFQNGQMKHDWKQTNTKEMQGFVTKWFQRVNQAQ